MKTKKIQQNSDNFQEIKVVNIAISDIIPPKLAMRINVTSESLQTLIESIKSIGLISPIAVMKFADKYEVVAGARRYFALKELGYDFVPCSILVPNSEVYFKTMSAENYERQEISLFDEVQFILKLHDELSLNQAQIGKYIGKSVSYVNERLAILNYPQCIKDALVADQITFSVAREFNKITEEKVCETYLRYAIENGCTPVIARKWRQQWENQQAHPQMTDSQDIIDNYEQSQQPVKVTQECASCHGTFESADLMPLYVCKPCRSAILT